MLDSVKSAKFRVFLVEDHPLIREQLKRLIQEENDLQVCGEAADAATASSFIHQSEPDLLVLDIALRRRSDLELLKSIRASQSRLPILVLSMYDDVVCAERALQIGARGYITKEEATIHMLSAIRKVLSGEIYLGERMVERLEQREAGLTGKVGSPSELLTDRELEVFKMIGNGLGTRQISGELGLSTKTVESYRARISEKLHLSEGKELIQNATCWVQRAVNSSTDLCRKETDLGATTMLNSEEK